MQWTNVTSADYCKPKNWMVEANLTLRHKSCVDKVPTFDVNYCRAGEEKSTRIQLHGKVEMHVWGESHPLWRKTWASSRLVSGRQQYIEKWTTGVKGSLQSWIPVDALFLSPNSVQNFPWPRKRIGPPLVSSPPHSGLTASSFIMAAIHKLGAILHAMYGLSLEPRSGHHLGLRLVWD